MSEGFRIDIDLQGAVELDRAFRLAPDIVTEELTRAAWSAELLLEREVKERTPIGVGGGGGLKGSISARDPRVAGVGVIGEVGTSLAYAIPVELGTRPHFPPIQPLADWAQAKLGVPREDARGVGFLIARKISREGTEGAHMFEEAFEENQRQVAREFAAARRRIADRIVLEAR